MTKSLTQIYTAIARKEGGALGKVVRRLGENLLLPRMDPVRIRPAVTLAALKALLISMYSLELPEMECP